MRSCARARREAACDDEALLMGAITMSVISELWSALGFLVGLGIVAASAVLTLLLVVVAVVSLANGAERPTRPQELRG